MRDQLNHLIHLQTMDNRLGLLRKEMAHIPERIEASRKSLDEARERLAQSQVEEETCNRQRREAERDLEIHEERFSKARARQSTIKTNKEYQAHLQEMETLMLEKGRVEEELLVLMEQTEVYKRRQVELAQAVKAAEREFDRVKQQLEDQLRILQIEVEGLEKEREALTSTMDRDLLKMYQNLKNLHRDLAVVPIQNGSCGGCHINIPPQRVAEVRTRERILACSQCQRILYWPLPAESPPAPTVTETGSL